MEVHLNFLPVLVLSPASVACRQPALASRAFVATCRHLLSKTAQPRTTVLLVIPARDGQLKLVTVREPRTASHPPLHSMVTGPSKDYTSPRLADLASRPWAWTARHRRNVGIEKPCQSRPASCHALPSPSNPLGSFVLVAGLGPSARAVIVALLSDVTYHPKFHPPPSRLDLKGVRPSISNRPHNQCSTSKDHATFPWPGNVCRA